MLRLIQPPKIKARSARAPKAASQRHNLKRNQVRSVLPRPSRAKPSVDVVVGPKNEKVGFAKGHISFPNILVTSDGVYNMSSPKTWTEPDGTKLFSAYCSDLPPKTAACKYCSSEMACTPQCNYLKSYIATLQRSTVCAVFVRVPKSTPRLTYFLSPHSVTYCNKRKHFHRVFSAYSVK
jgi:hypothetical protein